MAHGMDAAVQSVLSRAKLLYLATCEDSHPHLSLMTFSLVDGYIVMTTRKNTKKYTSIVANPHVALLIHDFDNAERAGTYSVTCYGTVEVVADEAVAASLRLAHGLRNPGYEQFISASECAVIRVRVTQFKLCNISDEVSLYSPAT